jgi:hypothetical protein
MVYNPGGQLGKAQRAENPERRPEKESQTTPRIKSDNATSRRCIGSVFRR